MRITSEADYRGRVCHYPCEVVDAIREGFCYRFNVLGQVGGSAEDTDLSEVIVEICLTEYNLANPPLISIEVKEAEVDYGLLVLQALDQFDTDLGKSTERRQLYK